VGARDSREQGFQQGSQKDIHRNHSILEVVVSGVASLRQLLGVPTSAAKPSSSRATPGNPLVNAFAMALVAQKTKSSMRAPQAKAIR